MSYYSLNYRALDFKVMEYQLAFDGSVVNSRQVANFAHLSKAIDDKDLARLVCEKMAREVAEKLNESYLKGWEDSSASAEMDWTSV